MKPYRLHRKAEEEYAAAAEHYARISPELGQRFYREIESLIAAVCAHPTLYRRHVGDIRRHFSPTFPYGILYRELPDEIRILAVMPLRRDPLYWQDR
ncbi:MAG: type II toxin-antitoxin system RelE/ParE family toxin [Opitutaceae bacterium]|nr:type II toxin-antitoxin system RelE/ParE family toxin [Opitutaceae bacterium]MBP9912161.1 type II toxin-antitoxin system RelE/ParE family toxin [Opitutaceae bacterium]